MKHKIVYRDADGERRFAVLNATFDEIRAPYRAANVPGAHVPPELKTRARLVLREGTGAPFGLWIHADALGDELPRDTLPDELRFVQTSDGFRAMRAVYASRASVICAWGEFEVEPVRAPDAGADKERLRAMLAVLRKSRNDAPAVRALELWLDRYRGDEAARRMEPPMSRTGYRNALARGFAAVGLQPPGARESYEAHARREGERAQWADSRAMRGEDS